MAGSINLTASAFNRLGQYASSPGNRAYCYAELAVTITSTHFAYPRTDGQAELTGVAWLNTKTVTHLSTNLARASSNLVDATNDDTTSLSRHAQQPNSKPSRLVHN